MVKSRTAVLFPNKIPSLPTLPRSSVLRNRPDILAGENKIRSQVSHLNAALLNLYPSIGIDLTGVGMSGDLSKPFTQWKLQGGQFWTFHCGVQKKA